MPAVHARRVIDAPEEAVWAVLADIGNAGRWNKAWTRVEFLGEQREGAGTTFRTYGEGGPSTEFEVVRWVPGEYIAIAPRQVEEAKDFWITLQGQALHLRPVNEEQTEVTIVASARSHGLRGWFVGRLIWPGYQKRGLESALEALAALFGPPEELEKTQGESLNGEENLDD